MLNIICLIYLPLLCAITNGQTHLDLDELTFHFVEEPGRARTTIGADGRVCIERPLKASFFLELAGERRTWASDRQINLLHVLSIRRGNWVTAEDLEVTLREVAGQRVNDAPINVVAEVKDWPTRIEGLNQALSEAFGLPLVQTRERDGRREYKVGRAERANLPGPSAASADPRLLAFSDCGTNIIYRTVILPLTPSENRFLKLLQRHPGGVTLEALRENNSKSARPFELASGINGKSFRRTGARLIVVDANVFRAQILGPADLNPEGARRYRGHELTLTALEGYVFDALDLGARTEPVRFELSIDAWERRLNIRPAQFLRLLGYINESTLTHVGEPAVNGVILPDPLSEALFFVRSGRSFEEVWSGHWPPGPCASLL